jgi:hypothetical protein
LRSTSRDGLRKRDLLPWCEQHGMPVSRLAGPAQAFCAIPRLHELAQRAVARQQPLRCVFGFFVSAIGPALVVYRAILNIACPHSL